MSISNCYRTFLVPGNQIRLKVYSAYVKRITMDFSDLSKTTWNYWIEPKKER